MILILTNNDENTTDEVIDWLHYYKSPFIRINGGDVQNLKSIRINDGANQTKFTVDGEEVCSDNISSYWYRRGEMNIGYEKSVLKPLNEINLSKLDKSRHLSGTGFQGYFTGEQSDIESFISLQFIDKKTNSIGNFYNNYTIKIQNLTIASTCGLNVPDTLVTPYRDDVLKFYNEHNQVIVKAIKNGVGIDIDNRKYLGMTTLFKKDDIDNLPHHFFPMLFQECLTKRYELRIFYLRGEFYASAIFSQNDQQTKVDFRNYNYNKPNRTPPFRLPTDLKEKLYSFMDKVNMDSGSIDMIVTDINKYVFLEVNPIGQFAQVSKPCNYYLERLVAKSLINIE